MDSETLQQLSVVTIHCNMPHVLARIPVNVVTHLSILCKVHEENRRHNSCIHHRYKQTCNTNNV